MVDNKMNFRTRLLLTYALPAILFILLSALVYVNAFRALEFYQTTKISRDTLLGTNEMMLRVSMMARQVRGYLLVGNAEGAAQSFETQKNKYLEARKGVETLIAQNPKAQQKERFSKMIELETQFEELSKSTFRLRDEAKVQEAINTYLRESKNNLGEFDKLNQEFTQIERDSLRLLSDDTEWAMKLISLSSIAITIIALVLAYMIFNLAKNLSSLIQQVQQSGIKITSSTTQIAASGKELEQ